MKNKNIVIDKPKSAIIASKNFRYQKNNSCLVLYLDKNKKLIFQKKYLLDTDQKLQLEKDIHKPIFVLQQSKTKVFFIIILYNKPQQKIQSLKKLTTIKTSLGIRLLDVIFISKNGYHSLHESGQIT